MDSALKQRLVGATVLVVLAVIFVPMLVDTTPRTDGEAIDLRIPPEPGQAFETRVVPLGPQTAPDGTAAPGDDPDRVVTVDTGAAPRRDAFAGTPAAPEEPVVSPAEPPASPVVDTAPAAPPPGTSPPPDTSAPSAATPAPSTRPPALPLPAAGGRWLVQFGTYAQADNAQALAAELGRAGIRSETERVEIDGKPALRVRSGPYADRTSAERVRQAARSLRADVASSVVESDARSAPDADPLAGRNPRTTGWSVQVGALADAADAEALRGRLAGAGFTAYVETLRTDRGILYRVRIGPEIQRAGAESLRDSIKARLGLDGQVVAHP
ncbi:MAG: SPOR domain-containing protein [Pseudomonadota bacterium]|jgi:DedD protein